MRIKLRLTLAAAAAAAVIPAIAAPSAMAQSAVNCQWTGQATTSGVDFVGGSGTYSTSKFTFTCEGVADGGAYSGAAALDMPTSGTFTNTACGTGDFFGSGSVSAIPIAGNLYQAFNGASVLYMIIDPAGEGSLTGTVSGPGGTFQILGTMSMVPTGGQSEPNTTVCTDNFEFASDLTFFSP